MALADILQRRVRASKAEIDEEVEVTSSSSDLESVSGVKNDDQQTLDSSSDDVGDDKVDDEAEDSNTDSEEDSSTSAPPPSSPHQALTTISFGALASAQASLGLKRKRPSLSTQPSKRRSPSPFGEAAERLAGKKDHRLHPRTSKHAPTELSSKKAVSRKRPILHAPGIAHRDPRFEALSGPLDTDKMERNYAFLNDYRSSEIAALKASIRNTKDLAAKEGLKRELLSMESREKARKARELEQEVLREHRRREKEAVQKGKKPFFLKKGEQKKLALVKRFEGMGEKKVERVIERRRKKKAAKERRKLPMARREGEERSEHF